LRASLLVVWLVFLPGCGIADALRGALTNPTEQIVATLNDGIGGLANASADWQRVLEETRDKLIQQGQSTIANEVSNALNRAIGATGAEFRCNVDFVRARVRQDLVRIRDRVLGLPTEAPEPALCDVVPLAVDLALVPARLNHLEFFGYDFDSAPIQVMLDNTSGSVDVTAKLDRPTHYHMTLNLGGNGVALGPTSQRLRLRWNGQDISTMAVLQPATPVCASKIVPFAHPPMTFIPPKVGGGDAEFEGHGPEVFGSVNLTLVGGHVDVTTAMTARETRSDWTTASGTTTTTFFNPDPGWRVEQIVEPTSSAIHYTDTTTDQIDRFGSTGGPVSQWEFVGDTRGNEAGTRTQVTAHFVETHFVVTQAANCVSPRALQTARAQNLLSPDVASRFEPALRIVDPGILRLPSRATP
jgi:hypothetical protein